MGQVASCLGIGDDWKEVREQVEQGDAAAVLAAVALFPSLLLLPLFPGKNTLLHVVARYGQTAILRMLLRALEELQAQGSKDSPSEDIPQHNPGITASITGGPGGTTPPAAAQADSDGDVGRGGHRGRDGGAGAVDSNRAMNREGSPVSSTSGPVVAARERGDPEGFGGGSPGGLRRVRIGSGSWNGSHHPRWPRRLRPGSPSRNGTKKLVMSFLLGSASTGAGPVALPTPLELVDARNQRGQTPLIIAASRGHSDLVRTLLNMGVDPFTPDAQEGCTALHYAAMYGYVECAKLLMQSSTARTGLIDLVSRGGATALHFACDAGHSDVVRLLCNCGADMNACMKPARHQWLQLHNGATPTHLAAEQGHLAVVLALLRYYHENSATIPTLLDPRMQQDRGGLRPHQAAFLCHHLRVALLLRPGYPLFWLWESRSSGRSVVPKLSLMAAQALKVHLCTELDALERVKLPSQELPPRPLSPQLAVTPLSRPGMGLSMGLGAGSAANTPRLDWQFSGPISAGVAGATDSGDAFARPITPLQPGMPAGSRVSLRSGGPPQGHLAPVSGPPAHSSHTSSPSQLPSMGTPPGRFDTALLSSTRHPRMLTPLPSPASGPRVVSPEEEEALMDGFMDTLDEDLVWAAAGLAATNMVEDSVARSLETQRLLDQQADDWGELQGQQQPGSDQLTEGQQGSDHQGQGPQRQGSQGQQGQAHRVSSSTVVPPFRVVPGSPFAATAVQPPELGCHLTDRNSTTLSLPPLPASPVTVSNSVDIPMTARGVLLDVAIDGRRLPHPVVGTRVSGAGTSTAGTLQLGAANVNLSATCCSTTHMGLVEGGGRPSTGPEQTQVVEFNSQDASGSGIQPGTNTIVEARRVMSPTGDACDVCFEDNQLVRLRPCCHSLCVECLRKMVVQIRKTPATCPFCRRNIAGLKAAGSDAFASAALPNLCSTGVNL